MSEYVYVRQIDTGYTGSVPKEHYDAVKKGYELLKDEPALDENGEPRPWSYGSAAKPKTTVAEAAAKKAPTGQQAATTKEKD